VSSGVHNYAVSSRNQEFAQLPRLQARHPDKHQRMFRVMISKVERLRIIRKKCRALFEIGSNHKRVRLR